MTADQTTREHRETSVRAVFNLAWPVMVSMLSYTAMSVVDTLFVSRLGTAPLAAVGLAGIVVFFTQSFGAGLMGGVRVLVSQATGANDAQTAGRVGWQVLTLALPLGVLMSLLSLAPAEVFGWLGAEADVAVHADSFFSIRILGTPMVLMNIGIAAYFQGRGDTVTPMKATLVSNALNMVLDPVLIFGLGPFPQLGVAGAALSTVIALSVQVVYLMHRARPLLRDIPSGTDRRLLKETLRMGVPIGVRYTLDMGSFVIFSSMITHVGAIELAAHVIVVRICSLSFLPGHAVGEAAGVLVGQFVGAKRAHLARPVVHSAIKLAVGIMATWGVVFMLLPELLIAPFGAEPAVASVASSLLMLAAAFQIFDAVVMAISGGLNGAGDTRWVMVVSLMGAWMIKVPAAYFGVFILQWGARGAWAGFTVELTLLALVLAWRLRGASWLRGAALDREI